MISKENLQKLRNLPIEAVAERLGLKVVRHKCLCPFHDDHHASLAFHARRNTFRCFTCGASGGTIDLVMRSLHLDFADACQWLAGSHSIILEEWKPTPPPPRQPAFDAARYERFFQAPTLTAAAQGFLFALRHIDPRVARWCRLSSWTDRTGTEWLQIPYYDTSHRLVGFQNRNLTPGASPRFRFPTGARCGIYNLPVLNLLRPSEPLYITEGASDCWAMLSFGHKAVAIPSATLLTTANAELFRKLQSRGTSFHMYPDQDAPGERLFLALRDILPNIRRHTLPPGCKDFSDYYLTLKKKGNTQP